MNLLITSKEQILAELTNIDSFLNITMSEDAAEAVQRGNDLAVYVARSGKLLADSKYWLNETIFLLCFAKEVAKRESLFARCSK